MDRAKRRRRRLWGAALCAACILVLGVLLLDSTPRDGIGPEVLPPAVQPEAPRLAGAPAGDGTHTKAGGEESPGSFEFLISVRVVDEWGSPVSTGDVVLRGLTPEIVGPVPTRYPVTGDGPARIRLQSRGGCTIAVTYTDDATRISVPVFVEIRHDRSGAEVTLTAYRTALMRVQVVAAGKPVPNATVTANPASLLGQHVTADSDGRCEIRVFPQVGAGLLAESPDQRQRGRSAALFAKPGEERDVRILLNETWRQFPIRLVSGGDRAVAGRSGRVRFTNKVSDWVDLLVDGPAVRVFLPESPAASVRNMMALVEVEGQKRLRFLSTEFGLQLRQGAIEFCVGFLGVVRLEVRDPAGNAATGLLLQIKPTGTQGPISPACPVNPNGIVDFAGTLELGPLPYGEYDVTSGSRSLGLDRLRVDAPVVFETLRVENVTTIGGSYAGPTAYGDRDIYVYAEEDPAPMWMAPASRIVRDGRWRLTIPLPPGVGVTVVLRLGLQPLMTEVEAVTGDHDIHLHASMETHSLAVRVQKGERVRVEGFVELRSEDTPMTYCAPINMQTGTATFLFVKPGSYSAHHFTHPLREDSVPATEPIVLEEGQTEVFVRFPGP